MMLDVNSPVTKVVARRAAMRTVSLRFIPALSSG